MTKLLKIAVALSVTLVLLSTSAVTGGRGDSVKATVYNDDIPCCRKR
jgi:hypothetical protein